MAINAIDDGKESDVLSYYSITLSSEPLNLDISNDENIKISWDVPSDTGTGQYAIKSYYLEYKDS